MKTSKKQYYTIPEVAEFLNISRVAVFNRIKKGQIKAEKIGRNYAIHRDNIPVISGKELDKETKEKILEGVSKVFNEYGEALEMLSQE